MARAQRQPALGLVFHSDGRCQYASAAFRRALAQTLPSMSLKAGCYDNAAAMKSF